MVASHRHPVSPFTALDAAHRDIQHHLELLSSLMDALLAEGVTSSTRELAGRIEKFFTSHAHAHHAEEERLVFPDLLALADERIVSVVQTLQQDHRWIEEDWRAISLALEAIAQGFDWYDIDELKHATGVFLELSQEHIALEESLVYPEAKALAKGLQRRRAALGPVRVTRAAQSSS